MTNPLNMKAIEVAQYLRSDKVTAKILSAAPGILKITGYGPYPAAFYMEKREDGKVEPCFYVLGDAKIFKLIGKKYKRDICFQFPEFDSWRTEMPDWYISGYVERETLSDPRYAQYHPFGLWFGIRQWDVPGGEKIDHYEDLRHKYRRVFADFHFTEGHYQMATRNGKLIVYEGATAFWIYPEDDPDNERGMGDMVDSYGTEDGHTLNVGSPDFYNALTRDAWTSEDDWMEAYYG